MFRVLVGFLYKLVVASLHPDLIEYFMTLQVHVLQICIQSINLHFL